MTTLTPVTQIQEPHGAACQLPAFRWGDVVTVEQDLRAGCPGHGADMCAELMLDGEPVVRSPPGAWSPLGRYLGTELWTFVFHSVPARLSNCHVGLRYLVLVNGQYRLTTLRKMVQVSDD